MMWNCGKYEDADMHPCLASRFVLFKSTRKSRSAGQGYLRFRLHLCHILEILLFAFNSSVHCITQACIGKASTLFYLCFFLISTINQRRGKSSKMPGFQSTIPQKSGTSPRDRKNSDIFLQKIRWAFRRPQAFLFGCRLPW